MHFEGMNLLARSSNIAFTLLRDKPIVILHSIQIKMILGTRNGDLLQATTLARGLRHDAGERKRERQKVLHLHAHTNSPSQSRFHSERITSRNPSGQSLLPIIQETQLQRITFSKPSSSFRLSKNQLNSNADVTSHQPKSTQSKSLSLHARTGPSLLTTTGLQSMNDHRFEYASTPSAHLCIAMVGALSRSNEVIPRFL
jgi:hypothetical protein